MNPGRATTRHFITCLLLSAVLILGIVQWSFLPVLIDSPSFSGGASIEVSPGHSSKFAAPFKYLSGTIDYLQTCLTPASLRVQIPPFSFSRRLDEPSFKRDDQVFSIALYARLPPPNGAREFPAWPSLLPGN